MSQCSLIVEQYVDCEQAPSMGLTGRHCDVGGWSTAHRRSMQCMARLTRAKTHLAAASRTDDQLRIAAHALGAMPFMHDKAALCLVAGGGRKAFQRRTDVHHVEQRLPANRPDFSREAGFSTRWTLM